MADLVPSSEDGPPKLYEKRVLEVIPFSSQMEMITYATLNQSSRGSGSTYQNNNHNHNNNNNTNSRYGYQKYAQSQHHHHGHNYQNNYYNQQQQQLQLYGQQSHQNQYSQHHRNQQSGQSGNVRQQYNKQLYNHSYNQNYHHGGDNYYLQRQQVQLQLQQRQHQQQQQQPQSLLYSGTSYQGYYNDTNSPMEYGQDQNFTRQSSQYNTQQQIQFQQPQLSTFQQGYQQMGFGQLQLQPQVQQLSRVPQQPPQEFKTNFMHLNSSTQSLGSDSTSASIRLFDDSKSHSPGVLKNIHSSMSNNTSSVSPPKLFLGNSSTSASGSSSAFRNSISGPSSSGVPGTPSGIVPTFLNSPSLLPTSNIGSSSFSAGGSNNNSNSTVTSSTGWGQSSSIWGNQKVSLGSNSNNSVGFSSFTTAQNYGGSSMW